MQEIPVRPLGGEDPLEEEMATHSSILAGKSHGQRGWASYSPWGRKESDMTKHARMLPSPNGRNPEIISISLSQQHNIQFIAMWYGICNFKINADQKKKNQKNK